MTQTNLTVLGAAGRMGQTFCRLIAEDPRFALTGAVEKPGSAAIGQDAFGAPITDDLETALAKSDGLIDFTTPAATLAALKATAKTGRFHIIGTTGMSADDDKAVENAAKSAAIVKAGNFSLGVNLLCLLTEKAAQALGPDFDIEVLEMHHRHKVDAPSGTALMLGEAAAKGRNSTLETLRAPVRDGVGEARTEGSIGFAALRGGSVIGEHSVILAGPSERIELIHKAEDRALFASGALAAALWAKGRSPGLYSMRDVLSHIT